MERQFRNRSPYFDNSRSYSRPRGYGPPRFSNQEFRPQRNRNFDFRPQFTRRPELDRPLRQPIRRYRPRREIDYPQQQQRPRPRIRRIPQRNNEVNGRRRPIRRNRNFQNNQPNQPQRQENRINRRRSQPITKLSLSNLGPDICHEDLIAIFGVYGKLKRCAVIYQDGKSTGKAVVQYMNRYDYGRAIKDFKGGVLIKGSYITIESHGKRKAQPINQVNAQATDVTMTS